MADILAVSYTHLGWACECGQVLDEHLTCPDCGRKYRKSNDGLVEEKE